MNALREPWSRLGLQRKLQLLIQGFLLVILLAAQFGISREIASRSLRAAEDRTATVADGVINALTTLMSARVGSHDVIDDPKIRELFIRKMGQSEQIRELRVIRGKGVIDEFGPGLANQGPVDELDRDVLSGGKPVYRIDNSQAGAATLRAVIPYIAYQNFRGSKCLECHGVDEGAVLGAISISSDIQADQQGLRRINLWLWLGQALLQVLLYFAIGAIVHRQLRELGAEPSQATQLARSVAAGDLSTPPALRPGDSHSMMAQLGQMQSSLSGIVARVRHGSEGVAIASREIAEGNHDLSARTEQQAAALEETASSMEQLGATVRQNADSAREANQLAMQATEVAARGGEVVGQVGQAISQMDEATQQNAALVEQMASAASSLNTLAQELVQTVAVFRLGDRPLIAVHGSGAGS